MCNARVLTLIFLIAITTTLGIHSKIIASAKAQMYDSGSSMTIASASGLPNATSRVFPTSITSVYPYSAVGKLFLQDPKTLQWHVCSGSVIKPRVVLTSAACVYRVSSSSSYGYTNVLFYPGMSSNNSSSGPWQGVKVYVSSAWMTSQGTLPSVADVGLIVMSDKYIPALGKTVRIGDVVGVLGAKTAGLTNTETVLLGYACNLDSCNDLEMSWGQSFATNFHGVFMVGSAMGPGVNGAPLIAGFGQGASSTSTKQQVGGMNQVVGVASYTINKQNEFSIVAVELNSYFTSTLQTVCSNNPSDCK